MAGVLSRVPGLGGFIEAGQLGQQQQMNQLSQLGAVQGMLAKAQQQKQMEAAAARDAQARDIISRLGPEATTADYLKALRPVSDPEKLLPLLQGEENRRMQSEAMKEAARGRLEAKARDLDFKYEKMRSDAKTDQQRLAVDAMYKAAKTAIDAEGLKLTGARVFYETGERPNIDLTGIYGAPQQGATPTPQARAIPATVAPGLLGPQQFPRGAAAGENPQAQLSILQTELADARQNDPEAVPALEREIARVSGGRVPVASVAPTGGLLPVSQPTPTAAPVDAPTQTPPVAEPEVPAWIQSIKSPKDRQAAERKWRESLTSPSAVRDARKDADNAKKDALRSEFAERKADIVIDKVDDALKKVGFFTTGAIGYLSSKIPGTDAYAIDRDIDTIKANIGFGELQAMREASPTGGALGQVAVQELNMLQAVLGSLQVGQRGPELQKNLKAVKRHFENWKRVMKQAGEAKGVPKVGDVVDGYRFKGGDPANQASWEKQ